MSDLSTTIEPWTLGAVRAATGGHLVNATDNAPILGVTSDSRAIPAQGLFVALKGERFDGHDFVASSIAAGAAGTGAAAALVDHIPAGAERLPLLVVPDTLIALGALAHAYRNRFQPKMAALTGSSGKTTTKDLLAAICRQRHNTLATAANLNNAIGVPLTLLRLRPETEIAVIELGMNHPGENRDLAAIAAAEVGILTSVGPSHLEGVGDEEGVLNAEAELIDDLNARAGAVVVLDADTAYFPRLAQRVQGRLVSVGTSPHASIAITDIAAPGARPASFSWRGRPVKLKFAGRHNVSNAAMAAAAAECLGCSLDDIVAGLESVEPRPNRSRVLERGGITIIDDCYNANPLSFQVALRVLAETPATRRVVVFADMRELGPESPRYHRELGATIATSGVALAVWRGTESAVAAQQLGAIETATGPDNASLVAILKERLLPGDVVLVKASHGMRLDQVVDGLLAHLPSA